MNIDRREFLRLLGFASAAGLLPLNGRAASADI